MANKIIHKHSNVVNNGSAKKPTSSQLDYGEIAVNYGNSDETIFIKNSSDEIVEFKSKSYVDGVKSELSAHEDTLADKNNSGHIELGTGLIIGSDGKAYIHISTGLGFERDALRVMYESPLDIKDNKLSIKLTSGLTKNNGAIGVLVGTALSIDGENAAINVNVGTGLTLTNNNEISLSIGSGLAYHTPSKTVYLGNHSSSLTDFGAASKDLYGHVKIGNGLNVVNGLVSVATGTTNNSIAVGNHTHGISGITNLQSTLDAINTTIEENEEVTALAITDLDDRLNNLSFNDLNDIPTGTTSGLGIVRLSNSTGSTSTTEAATPKAVNDVYKLANSKAPSGHTSATASTSQLGHVKVGNFLSASTNGTLSVKTGTTSSTVAVGNHTHSNYSTTGHTHSNYSPTGHTHNNYSPTGHTHASVENISCQDTRSIDSKPYQNIFTNASGEAIRCGENKSINFHIKTNSTLGLTGEGNYSSLLKISPWSDNSGGCEHQLAFSGNGRILHRYGTEEWEPWEKLLTSSNVSSFLSLNANGALSVKTGKTSDTVAVGNHTHSNYSPTGHTHSNYSPTGHTHSNYSPTGHTHSNYLPKDGVLCGMLNVTNIENIKTAQNNLSNTNQVSFYIITDNNGKLPSKTTCVDLSADIIKQLSLTSPNSLVNITLKAAHGRINVSPIGVNVGDMIALTRVKVSASDLIEMLGISLDLTSEIEIYQYRIISFNDAKAPNTNGITNGVMGLMTPSDKVRINKIDGIIENILPSKWANNMNEALETGVYPWCTLGRPSGSTGAYTCIVKKTSTNDGNYDTIEQTAYGREGELGQIYKRIIFYKIDGTDTQYHNWRRIDDHIEASDALYDVIEHTGNTFDQQTFEPNVLHVFNSYTLRQLSFNMETSKEIEGKVNEYIFQFRSSRTGGTSLTLPEDVKWLNGKQLIIEPERIYQVSIINNLVSYSEFF
jgi:hypothetical protein